jgi:hypothetical protein
MMCVHINEPPFADWLGFENIGTASLTVTFVLCLPRSVQRPLRSCHLARHTSMRSSRADSSLRRAFWLLFRRCCL